MERRCILKEMIELRRAIRALMREARATVATFSDGKCHSHAAGRSVIRITSISLMKCDREKRMIDEQRRYYQEEATMPNCSESLGSGRAARCAVCEGKFGLIRYYSWRTSLCSKKCVDRFRARRASDRSWVGWLQIALDQAPENRARAR